MNEQRRGNIRLAHSRSSSDSLRGLPPFCRAHIKNYVLGPCQKGYRNRSPDIPAPLFSLDFNKVAFRNEITKF